MSHDPVNWILTLRAFRQMSDADYGAAGLFSKIDDWL
jgi:hypothetical protein